MRDYYSKYSNEYSWLIKQEGWVKSLQGIRESQMALGNGFLGSRAILEELPYDTKPGTYLAGLYDDVGSQVAELVNLPNPFNFKITADGEKMGIVTTDVEKHKRSLNLRHGLLLRHSVFQDTRRRKYDYQSLRFVSMHDKNLGVMQIVFTPLDDRTTISVQTGIDTSVYNSGTVTEGRKKHFRIKELGQFKNEGYLVLETFSKSDRIIFRSGFYYETRGKKVVAKDNIFELKLRKKQTVVFTKIFYIDRTHNQKDLEKVKRTSEKNFRKAFQARFSHLVNRHIRAWEDLWDVAEVSVWTAPEIEKNFRFNIYHMLICRPQDNGLSSVGAKALTGEGYRGHIFWDAEIFAFPFYLYTFPEAAKNMLLYRYRRLDAARAIAKAGGFKGAMFPWESAGLDGKDQTPDRAKDLDGEVIRIHTGEQEQHLTADVAYAFHQYYNATNDEKFLRDCGYEIFFETARFWASRVEYNKRKNKYEIKHVIGPDEFHPDVNNNAFTNVMARWNLTIAYEMSYRAKKSAPLLYQKLAQKIGLSAKEPAAWKKIAARISIKVGKDKLIEQFDGFFKKRKVKISTWDENYIPIITQKLTPRDYAKTQLIKQGDVVIFLYLLSGAFSAKAKKKNYEYYLERTLHKSSLSIATYAIMAIDAGDRNRAYRFFNAALHTDLSDLHANTQEGIHIACIGGTWQILINGFAGVRIEKGVLSINPKLPGMWRKILFSLRWRERLLRLEVKNNEIKIRLASPEKKKGKLKIKAFGILHELSGGKTFDFKREKGEEEKKTYYL